MTSDPRVQAQGWGLTSKSSTCSKYGISVSKFSRRPYLEKHLIRNHSYLDHRYPEGLLSFQNIIPRGPCRDGAGGQNRVDLQNVGFMRQGFPEVHTLTTTYKKAFIRGFTFILWHLTPGSTPRVETNGQNLELFKLLYFIFQESIPGQPLIRKL